MENNQYTPKEKAASMVLAFTPVVLEVNKAKECATVQVNETIAMLLEHYPASNLLPYYKDVRFEIEKF
jgi:hypothetical protein